MQVALLYLADTPRCWSQRRCCSLARAPSEAGGGALRRVRRVEMAPAMLKRMQTSTVFTPGMQVSSFSAAATKLRHATALSVFPMLTRARAR